MSKLLSLTWVAFEDSHNEEIKNKMAKFQLETLKTRQHANIVCAPLSDVSVSPSLAQVKAAGLSLGGCLLCCQVSGRRSVTYGACRLTDMRSSISVLTVVGEGGLRHIAK